MIDLRFQDHYPAELFDIRTHSYSKKNIYKCSLIYRNVLITTYAKIIALGENIESEERFSTRRRQADSLQFMDTIKTVAGNMKVLLYSFVSLWLKKMNS